MVLTWLPVIIFVVVYFVICGVGSGVLLYNVEPFLTLYKHTVGIAIPHLTTDQTLLFYSILCLGPFFLTLGFGAILYFRKRWNYSINLGATDITFSSKTIACIFYFLLAVAIFSLKKNGAFKDFNAWQNYELLINARWSLFASLSFFEFVNIYVLLPTTAALVLLMKPKQFIHHITRWIPLLLVLGIDFFLYQKIPLLFTLLTCGGALWFFSLLTQPRRLVYRRFTIIALVVALFVAYSSVFFPNFIAPKALETNHLSVKTSLQNEKDFQTVNTAEQLAYEERPYHAFSPLQYMFLSLIMRMPPQLFYYTTVFPHLRPYYPIDVGQDILGFGTMPNDSHDVWHFMNPNQTGSTAAPINFVFYSQGGLAVVFVGMFIVGVLIGLCWSLILTSKGGIILRTLLGTTLLLFSLHLTLDSLRNTVIASYGFLWAGLYIGILYVVAVLNDKWLGVNQDKKKPLPQAQERPLF